MKFTEAFSGRHSLENRLNLDQEVGLTIPVIGLFAATNLVSLGVGAYQGYLKSKGVEIDMSSTLAYLTGVNALSTGLFESRTSIDSPKTYKFGTGALTGTVLGGGLYISSGIAGYIAGKIF